LQLSNDELIDLEPDVVTISTMQPEPVAEAGPSGSQQQQNIPAPI
jgi:hypothetical protein